MQAARVASDAGAGILRKAIDTSRTEAEQLIAALPELASSDAAALPPVGNVGRRLDIRM